MANFRFWALRALPCLGMLIPYFFTVVVANMIYASPFGRDVLATAGYPTIFLSFPETFTVGYFTLLLLPLLLVPLAYKATQRALFPAKGLLLYLVTDIGRPEYAAATLALVAYVASVFWSNDILSIFAQGKDAISSVEARFLILKTVGLKPRIALHSVLWFLSLYAFIRALRDHEIFWIISSILTAFVVAISLTLLNMKWPVLVYFLAILFALFAFSKWPYTSLVLGSIILTAAYVLISASVFRVSAEQAYKLPSQAAIEMRQADFLAKKQTRYREGADRLEDEAVTSAGRNIDPSSQATDDAVTQTQASWAGRYIDSLASSLLVMVVNPFNRMAIAYPYYYSIFTREGPVCGGPFSQIMDNPPCTPTWMVYTKIFPEDAQFAGRGTSPAGVNITGYALGGWPVAIIELILAGIVLGVYASLPLNGSSTLGALFVTGSIVGYHFSQLPIEGPFIYDHGVLWSSTVVLLLVAATRLRHYLAEKSESWKSLTL